MRELPKLTVGQSWCCANGCGECCAKESAFEYSREEFPNGDVISKTQRIFVSACCEAELMLWDEVKQDFVELGHKQLAYERPAQEAPNSASSGERG